MNKNSISLIILVVITLILSSCAASPKSIEGAERAAVLAYSEPMADNELAALNANDYEAFIKEYDEKMLGVTTQQSFTSLYTLIKSKLGNYVSREVTAVTAVGEDGILVVYSAKFEKEENVTIKIYFQPGGDHLISGLWMTSPKLRE